MRLSQDQLVRTASPLLLTTALNGALGIAYWVVAARLFDQRAVADNAALIATMVTLSGIAQLNLGQGLGVLVPRAVGRARRVIIAAYVAVTAFSVVVLWVFLMAVLPRLDELADVLDGVPLTVFFVVGVAVVNLFALQDAALVALRRGCYVPVENAVFGAAKLLLLLPFATLLPQVGIFASWVIPMCVLVPVISTLVLMRSARVDSKAPEAHGAAEPWHRLALDYVSYLAQIASTLALPVIAFELLPPPSAAVFSIVWLSSSSVDLLAINVGTALTVEASYGRDAAMLRRTVLRRGMGLVGGVCALGIVFAPWVLALYGPDYARDGVATLRLLLLAGIGRSLVTFAVAEARAHRHIEFIVVIRCVTSATALGLAFLLVPGRGPAALATAWLIAQGVGGCIALVRLLMPIRRTQVTP